VKSLGLEAKAAGMGYPASSAAGQAVPFHPESGGNHSVKPSGSHSGTKLSAR